MNNSPFKVVWLKAWGALTIPIFTVIGGALTPYISGDAVIPQSHGKRWLIGIIIFAAAYVAGYSGLTSFLSTTFAEHKAKQESGVDDDQPAPITAAQVAASPVNVSVPSVKPASIEAQPKEIK